MENKRTIHNLDSLEKEIFRLQIEAMSTGKKLSTNFHWVQQHAGEIVFTSLISLKRASGKQEYLVHLFRNESISRFVISLADRIADRAASSIDTLLKRIPWMNR